MTVLEALLVALIAFIGNFDYALGSLYYFRPICLCPLVGLALGDINAGLTIGAYLELFFIGSVSVGGYIPPDVIVASTIATAFSIKSGITVEAAITLSLPVALLALAINNVVQTILPFVAKIGDRSAARGEKTGINISYWVSGLMKCSMRAILVFVACLFGSEVVTGVVEAIPPFITDGMSAATGLLPALGFAMLIKMIISKENVVYYFLGFLLASFLGIPTLGVALFGLIFVIIKFDLLNLKGNGGNELDDDF